jgi:hypothetical protein
MRRLPAPTLLFNDVYDTCVQGKHEPARTSLTSIAGQLGQMEVSYRALAVDGRLHQLPIHAVHPNFLNGKGELNRLYDERMAKNPSPGRNYYDAILAAGLPRCPYCNHNRPRQLDHVLPKEAISYPELSLAPINLVPSCSDCNFLKRTHNPAEYCEEFFHPYFEAPEQVVWLSASLDFGQAGELTVLFDTNAFEGFEPYSRRINFQFTKLELGALYAAQAATELGTIRYGLELLYDASDLNVVRERMREDYESHNAFDQNSWKSAMYRAAYQSDRFCCMDWEL